VLAVFVVAAGLAALTDAPKDLGGFGAAVGVLLEEWECISLPSSRDNGQRQCGVQPRSCARQHLSESSMFTRH
jgi:hypothetical protein